MPVQIKRLLIYFTVFIGLIAVSRYLLVPESFGQFGHYRGNSLAENADKPIHYSGAEACNECHDDIMLSKNSDLHADLSCETCHGPGQAHFDDPEAFPVERPSGRDYCTSCHAMNPARNPRVIAQIDPEDHNTDHDECIDCHNPHMPWEMNENTQEETLSEQLY